MNIHELLTPNLLHQVIKGTFKDHLIQWVEDYLIATHGASKAETILDKINHQYVIFPSLSKHTLHLTLNSIALAPLFPGVRRFKQGQRFKQWTGDNSRALMKVTTCHNRNSSWSPNMHLGSKS